MLKHLLFFLACVGLFYGSAWAQSETCGSHARWDAQAAHDQGMLSRKMAAEQAIQTQLRHANKAAGTQSVITIPVVVHVVYNTNAENISDTQIVSQIAVLNLDYRRLNADTLAPGHPFKPDAADAELQFCLAVTDPNGAPTNGITRTQTTRTSFSSDDAVKHTAMGGQDGWDPTQYLNIWVCDLQPLMGYSSFPTELANNPSEDGIVCSYKAFGTIGTVMAPFNLGRTATHEIGHWLNLFHIFSGPPCGDDSIPDTPPAEGQTYGCPTFPHHPNNACGSGPDGEMFMNFMTSVDDGCMNLFTNGQKARMQAVIALYRPSIATSLTCFPATATPSPSFRHLVAAPNPSNGQVEISMAGNAPQHAYATVYNALGEVVYRADVPAFPHRLALDHLPSELYFLQLQADEEVFWQKLVLAR